MNDGTTDYNSTNYRVSFFYDLVKTAVNRMAFALGHELRAHKGTAVAVTPGWLRSEAMLDAYSVTEANWWDATTIQPHFAISETPAFVGRAVAALAGDPDVSRWNGHRCRAVGSQVYGFTISTAASPMHGGISSRCRMRGIRRMLRAIADRFRSLRQQPPRTRSGSSRRIFGMPAER